MKARDFSPMGTSSNVDGCPLTAEIRFPEANGGLQHAIAMHAFVAETASRTGDVREQIQENQSGEPAKTPFTTPDDYRNYYLNRL